MRKVIFEISIEPDMVHAVSRLIGNDVMDPIEIFKACYFIGLERLDLRINTLESDTI